jgi:dCTP deaminase
MSMLTDSEIRAAIDAGDLEIAPFEADCLQPASYDFRVGAQAYLSGNDGVLDVANKGLVIIEPGEFAVLMTREMVTCSPQYAAQLGLDSRYARQGLMLLSGPQIDPGFRGVLIVRVTNLAPRRVTLSYETPFLTVQFFRLAERVARPYAGSRQGQAGLGPNDIEELTHPDSPTLGGMVKSLSALAEDVGELNTTVARLEGSMSRLSWVIPLLVAFGIAVTAIIVGIK